MFNNKKSKRGFSLVELMVVVAIMGTLAAIAIPAYNGYRKTAKKSTYRADLTSLHKAWLAFGVELDSFCERGNEPVSINNVGMGSLVSSKLYGQLGDLVQCDETADNTDANDCQDGIFEQGHTCMGTCEAPIQITGSPSNAPGKHNFVGFADENCPTGVAVSDSDVGIIGNEGTERTTPDSSCDLGVSAYEMGVYGNISGTEYFGQAVTHLGVFSNEQIKTSSIDQADSGC